MILHIAKRIETERRINRDSSAAPAPDTLIDRIASTWSRCLLVVIGAELLAAVVHVVR